MKVEYGVAKTYEDLINNTTSELLWIDGKKVEEAELVIAEKKEVEYLYKGGRMSIIIKIVAIILVIFLMINAIKYILDIAKGK